MTAQRGISMFLASVSRDVSKKKQNQRFLDFLTSFSMARWQM